MVVSPPLAGDNVTRTHCYLYLPTDFTLSKKYILTAIFTIHTYHSPMHAVGLYNLSY